MRLSVNWLREFTPYEGEVQVLSDRLTMLGLEVEDILKPFAGIAAVVTGRVVEKAKHPEADKLSVCRVDVGSQTLSIVCGAPNVEAGQNVPVAVAGTTLPGGLAIKQAAIRGVSSAGMICSEKELGLSEQSSGIMVLPGDVKPGRRLIDALALDEVVLEVSVTPNRADCLSHLGLARETAMAFDLPLSLPAVALHEQGTNVNDFMRIEIAEPELCPVYLARAVTGARVAKSPDWMRFRLAAVGVRSLSNIVDVTNYVLMEVGQPLHAFDLSLLEGGVIRVARAAHGQVFTTLDNQQRALTANDTLICDGVKAVALAGVMGGANSEINDASRDVLIECAVFNPALIRKTARRLGLNSEASYRFERGVDQPAGVYAVNRAAALMAETAGGSVNPGIARAEPRPYAGRELPFRPQKAGELLGLPMAPDFCRKTLTGLGCQVDPGKKTWAVTPPPYRLDLEREVDLIEEVGRVYGLDRIPAALPRVAKDFGQAAAGQGEYLAWLALKNWAKGAGLREVINYSFVGQKDLDLFALPDAPRIPVANPLSEDQNVMRLELAPGMLYSLKANLAQGNTSLRLFELAKIFRADPGSQTTASEPGRLGIILHGERQAAPWPWPREDADYLDAKGLVEHLFASFGLPAPGFGREQDHPWLSPAVRLSLSGQPMGLLGRILPGVADAYHAKKDVWYAEIDADAFLALVKAKRTAFSPLPKFPPVRRDATLAAPVGLTAAALVAAFKEAAPDLLEDVFLADLFVPETGGVRNLTLRLTYRAPDRTLTDAEVDGLQATLIAAVTGKLPVKF